jgi:hypothetical protein
MKRLAFAMLVPAFVLGAAGVFANSQVRLGLSSAVQLPGGLSFETVHDSFAERSGVFHGLFFEVVQDHIGVGMHGLVRFDRLAVEPGIEQWQMDWDGDLFVGLHLAGVGRLFDPFVELGVGSAGRVNLEDREGGTWVQDDAGVWHYLPAGSTDSASQALTNLSVFPYVAGGLALDLRGLLLGTRVCYRPWNDPVPGTDFATYPLPPFQVTLFGGLALGGRR